MNPEIQWKDIDGQLSAVVSTPGRREKVATWAPQPGSQEAFLSCPIFEVLYEGTRGPGKTDALLMDFGQHVGQGWGLEWKGVLFRRTYPELRDVIDKSQKWFPRIWPKAIYNHTDHFWHWPDGEKLMFRQFMKPSDYTGYHGHAYPWIAWEELTSWPDDKCFKVMISCSRSSQKGMPRKYRATTNPYGIGHNWVKSRYNLPVQSNRMTTEIMSEETEEGQEPLERIAIHGHLRENKILLHAEPNYITKIKAAARNPAELAAWLHGDWNITSGGMFDDLWRDEYHVLRQIDPKTIPHSWTIDRSYDHGQSRPFSVGWWAESSGEPIPGTNIGQIRGDLIRIKEWYGWSGTRNEGINMLATKIAEGILDLEEGWGIRGRVRVGPADASIYDPYEGTKSVATDMADNGVRWTRADKGPGSRRQGWQQMRKLMTGSIPNADGTREDKGMFVTTDCAQFRITVPGLPRSERDMDDVDTTAEDHIGDETRYRVRRKNMQVNSGSW